MILLAGLAAAASASAAQAETRTLKLYHVHLKEKTEITFKRDGKYLSDGLKKANWALRDWRESKPTTMDPKLLDLLWEAHRQSGSRGYIHVIGGYRSPGTNAMLRSRSSGVAGTSLHMSGKAVDFFMPDVPLKTLRDIGMRMQLGGVGYYPRSGSPFVHFDTGKGRYWPRMSRTELARLFPKGNTIHLPADGKPLPGYETALASYNKRKGSNDIQIASSSGSRGGKSLLAMIFGGGAEEAEDEAEASSAPVSRTPPARAAPERAAPEPQAEVQIAAVKPSRAAPEPRAALPAGVPMPDRDTFDSSAPPRVQPPAGLPAADETQIAALVPARVPLPTTAPSRPGAAETPVPETLDSTLMAAIEEEAPPAAPGQLAYAVPMPRERPPFEAVLRGEQAALPTQKMIGGPAMAVALAQEPELTPEAIIAAAMPDAAGRPGAFAAQALPVAYPAARPETSQIAAAMPRPVPRVPTEKSVLVAALEPRPPTPASLASMPAGTKPAASVLRSGSVKGGRVVGDEAALAAAVRAVPRPGGASAATIARRVEIASLITAPERRAVESKLARPVADTLIGNLPAAVFARGFSSKGGSPSGTQHFEGKAVNFLPVRKLD